MSSFTLDLSEIRLVMIMKKRNKRRRNLESIKIFILILSFSDAFIDFQRMIRIDREEAVG